jgi:hypothetical protein
MHEFFSACTNYIEVTSPKKAAAYGVSHSSRPAAYGVSHSSRKYHEYIMNNRDTHVPGIPKMVQHREGKS